jgi:hypothetical protein
MLGAAAAAALVVVAAGPAAADPGESVSDEPTALSRIRAVHVSALAPVGVFAGAGYVRLVGTLDGVVGPEEDVVGLDTLPRDADGAYHYSAEFEMITAAPGQPRSDGVLVEAENRGNPFVFDSLQNLGLLSGSPSTIGYPPGLGNGFLQRNGVSWARVQWQGPNGAAPPVNPTVPAGAQGVGEVIVRDFGLLLRGADPDVARAAGIPTFDRLVLVGVSQSAWFVNTFIAEGFNEAPHGHRPVTGRQRQVYDGAYTQNGVGNWLGINQTNRARGFGDQTPYVRPNGVPLTPADLLRRPATDPFLVDTTAYTDFYRVRASLFNTAPAPPNLREYNLPNAHSSAASLPVGTTPARFGCAVGGTAIPALNPLDGRPLTRAAVLGLLRRVGVRGLDGEAPLLPPSTRFDLTDGPAPPDLDLGDPALPLFNFLPGVTLRVPVVDPQNQPVGGVTFPDVALTLGVPSPVAVPPVATRSITDTCGNLGGWRPFTAAQLAGRYGDVERYLSRYAVLLDRLIADGYVLPGDRPGILDVVRARYTSAPAA